MSENNEIATVKDYMEKDSLTIEDINSLRKIVFGSEKSRKIIKSIMEKLEADTAAKRNTAKAHKLALAYWFSGRDEDALALLNKNLKNLDSYVTYINWCVMKERFSEAYDIAIKGLKNYPKDDALRLLCAHAAVKCDNITEAEKIAKAVAKTLKPLNLEKLETDQENSDEAPDDSIDTEKKPARPASYPLHSSLFYLQGLIEESKGNWENSLDLFNNAILADKNNILAYFRKAYSLDLHGMDEQAMATYEQARHLRPLHMGVLFNLGVLYEDTGKNRKAAMCYKTILEDNPNHYRARLFLKDTEAAKSMVYDEEEEKEQDKLLQVFNTPISDFELSVRSRNCLAKMNIHTLGDLSKKTESELLSYKNFGETSLTEIKALLTNKNLSLGMSSEELFKTSKEKEIDESSEEENERPELLDTSINSMNFSVRCKRAFEKLGMRTLGDLVASKESDFQGLRNFGQTSYTELKSKLAEYGLTLKNG